MEKHLFLILILTSGVMTADQIGPNKETSVIKKEDETVTLSCSYETDSNYVRLYWYRQYLNGEPQYLMWKEARSLSDTGRPSDPRFQLTTSKTSTELIIKGVTLSDSALYYCALRVEDLGLGYGDPLTFGVPIRLTVEPNNAQATPPALSILSPVDGQGQDICLAAGFFPREKTMILEGKELKTDDAALFASSKSYYYAGFNGGKIQTCKMDTEEATPHDASVTEKPIAPTPLACPTNGNSAPASEIINSDDPKMNSITLLVTGLRILLAKCVAVNVLMSVKAFLF